MEENQVYSDNIGKLYRDAVSRGMKADEQTFRNYLAESDENRRKVFNDLVARGMKADENQFFEYIGYPFQQPAPAPRVDVSDVEAAEQTPPNPLSEGEIPTVTGEQVEKMGRQPAWMPNRMGGVGGDQNYMPQQTGYIERSKQQPEKVLNEEETAKIETLDNLDTSLGEIKQKRRQGFWKTVGGMFGDLAISSAMAEGGMSYEDRQQLQRIQGDIRKTNSVNMAINQNLHDAENTLKIARKNIEEGEGSVAERLGRGVRYANLDNVIPVSQLYGQMGVLQLYDKLNEDGTPKEPLTEDEQTLYEALALNQHAQQAFGGDLNMLNRIGKGLPEQAMFTLSFLLSSEFAGAQAIGRVATKALQRGISKGIKREIKTGLGRFMLDKALPTAFRMGAETLYRTGLQVGNIAEGAIERHVGNIRIDPETGEIGGFENGVDWGEAVWKSAASVANENATELLGERVFEPGWAWLGRNTKAGRKIADFRKAIGKMGDGRVDDILKMGNDISQKAGWQGWAFETLEELAGNFNDAAFIHDQTWEQAFSKETLMETTLNCMIFGMAMGTSTTSLQALRNMPSAVETRNAKRLASAVIGRMDDISTEEIDQHIESDKTNDLSQWLVAKYDQGGWNDGQRAAVANYVRAAVAQKARRNFKGMQLQEEVDAMEERVDAMTNNQSGDVIEANFKIDGQMQTGIIIAGRVSVTEDDVLDAGGNPRQAFTYNPHLSSVTVSVRVENSDGTVTKKMIPARDVESINSVTSAEQYKAERTQELTQAMQDSVKAMYEPPTLSEIWGTEVQPGAVLTINGGTYIVDGHNVSSNEWTLTQVNPDGTPMDGGQTMTVDDASFRTMGLLEKLNAMQQQGASEEEMDDVVSDLNAEEGLKNIDASDNEDNIWDNIAGFMQGYFKANEEGDPIPDESRPEAVAGYIVALQKGDIGKAIGIVDERIAELRTRLAEKPQQVENNGEGVVGMAANQSLADSAAEEIRKQVDFLTGVRDGLVAKQQEQAQMEAQKPVSQMQRDDSFPVVFDGQEATAIVREQNTDGNGNVLVDIVDAEGEPIVGGAGYIASADELEGMRVRQQEENGTDRTDGTDNVPQPEPAPQPEPTPTPVQPQPEPAPQPQVEYPKNKKGKPDYDLIDDPALFAQALTDEFGEKALGILDETIQETKDDMEGRKAIERARIGERLAMLEAAREILQPQGSTAEAVADGTDGTNRTDETPVEQPTAETPQEEEMPLPLSQIEAMSDEELLQLMKKDGNGDINKALNVDAYDEYDSRHNDDYVRFYDEAVREISRLEAQLDNGNTEKNDDIIQRISDIYKEAEDEWDNGGSYSNQRIRLEARMDAANEWLDKNVRGEGEKTSKTTDEAPAETPMESAGEGTEQTGEPEQVPEQPAESVPDWTEDTAKAARERGYRMVDGERVERQEPIEGVEGNEVEVKFSDTEKPKGKWMVVEAESLQPSHRNKRRNPSFFITEAQPKERTTNDDENASTKIAQDINPDEVMLGNTVDAYGGSPVVNSRGEVIQGNNRTIGMQKMYESYPESQEKYKQALMDSAEQIRIDKDAISKMKHPVLVRSIDVDDDTAIKLGQRTKQDTESGGKQRMGASQVRNGLGDKYANLIEMLFADTTEDEGIGEAIARNGVTALKYLWNQKVINNTQYQSALENGDLTAEAKEDFRNIIMESLFEGGPDGLRTAFNMLPSRSQNAILQTIYRDAKNIDENKIKGEVQQGIMAFAELMGFADFVMAKDKKSVESATETWKNQGNMFSGANNSEKYSNFALELAKRFKWQTLRVQRAFFNELYNKLQGVASEGLSMFEEVQQLGLAEAIKAVYGIDYLKPQQNNGISGSDVVADDNGTRQEGEPGGTGENESGERAESGERPADDRGRDERADRTGQENQGGEEVRPQWKYDLKIDHKTGRATIERYTQIEGGAPVFDARWKLEADSPVDMLGILTNPSNGLNADDFKSVIEVLRTYEPKEETPKAEPKEDGPKEPEGTATGNTIFTEDEYLRRKEALKRRHRTDLNIAINPQDFEDLLYMAGYHIERDVRKFADFCKNMIADLGDWVRPYLQTVYLGAKADKDIKKLGIDRKEWSSEDEVLDFDVENFDKTASQEDIDKIKEIAGRPLNTKKEQETEAGTHQYTEQQKRKFSDAVRVDMRMALERGEKPYRSINDIRKRAESLGMEVDKEGRDDIMLQELVEDGLVRAAREVVESGRYGGAKSKDAFDAICQLYEMQPTISRRSANRVKMQQYSTPLPMAFVADMFAYKGGKVLEPTAGNGMLVFAIPSKNVTVNELDETRLANLREQGFPMVLNEDALTVRFVGKYDSVIANPPFGSSPAKDYDGKMIAGLDEQITLNALSAMKDDGRAAIIIGGNMEYGKNGSINGNKAFWTYLYNHYNVKGVVDMDGKLYGRQGTTYPTRMILIEGRRSEEDMAQSTIYPPVKEKAVRKAESFDDLYDIVNELLSLPNKTNGNEVLRDKPPVSDNDNPRGDTGVRGHSEESDANDSNEQGGTVGTGSTGAVKPNATTGVQRPKGTSGSVDAGLGLSGVFGTQTSSSGQGQTATDSGTAERPGRGTDVGGSTESEPNGEPGRVSDGVVSGVGDRTNGVGLTQKPKEQEKRTLTEEKLPYRPHNSAFSLESVAPAAMVEAMDESLAEIEKTYGKSIDEFVTDELGYDSVEDMHNALAAEQVDGVAMAIHQMKQGQAMIIGDQTGVGKGRQMAALIRWAHNQGKKPIFITKDANLFSDIYRDLVDVGSSDLKPFIFNKFVKSGRGKDTSGEMVDADGNLVYSGATDAEWKKAIAEGKLPDGYDYAVLTYSQVNTGDKQSRDEAREAAKSNGGRGNSKKKNEEARISPKAPFLRQISKDNYLLLDESHSAAGDSNTGAFLQSIVRGAKGVTFASATFAKRPDTMPLYAIRTAMSKANVKANELISIIKKGGVTLQEIMSRALTQAGQMVRRERDMSDVKTDWITVKDAKTVAKARENYDKTIAAFNAIIKFQNDYVKPMIAALSTQLADIASSADVKKGTDNAGVDNVQFASKTYNYTKQLMLALKVDAIVDKVVAEIEAGRHPVIALESTMESFLDDYAIGDVIKEPTLSLSLLKGLDSVLQYTITDEDGHKIHQRYTPEDLGEEGAKAYYDLQDLIRKSTEGIFISPLDAIISKLNEKGYKVGELTGRNTYLEYDDQGRATVRSRTDKDKKRMQRDFNSGNLDVLILNKSASTGISLHASKKFSDQRQRTMVIAQPLSDINDYMQMIGRIDRTGQVHRGYYINLGLPVPAENRFLMMLATKLKSLNANTTTSQESESNSVEAPDLLNKYGSKVIVEYLRDNPEIYVKMGEPLGKGKDKVTASKLDDYEAPDNDEVARKITGRAALLTTKEQDDFYNDVVKRYTDLIKYLDDTGQNDLKITVMPLRAKTIDKKVSSPGSDPNGSNPFAKDAYVETVEIDVLRKPMKADEVRKEMESLNTPKGTEKGHFPTVAADKTFGDRVLEILGIVQRETQAKLRDEEERYEESKKRALEDIAKKSDKIRAQQKLSAEEKEQAIADYVAERNALVEQQHDRAVERIQETERTMQSRLGMFVAGSSYLMPDQLNDAQLSSPELASPAIFLGYKAKESKVTPSTTFAVFATFDGRRRIELKLSDAALFTIRNMSRENYDLANRVTLENWDSELPTSTRKNAYIMTGNILQAVAATQDENGNYPGQLISYTDENGDVHDGILMPDRWQPAMLRDSGVPINARLQQILEGGTVESTDKKVKIESGRGSGSYTITVPKTKKDGEVFFNNPVIQRAVSNGFFERRGKFQADIQGEENLRAVVAELAKLGVKVTGKQQGDGEVMYRDDSRDLLNDEETKGFFESSTEYDAEKVAEFNKWLKDHAEDYVRLYHGTNEKNDILGEGILKTTARRRNSYQSESGYVYLSLYPGMARTFGELGSPFDGAKVYAVDVKIKELKPDTDQLRNKRLFGGDEYSNIGDTLADSLLYGNGARVKRSINPYEVEETLYRIREEEPPTKTGVGYKVFVLKDGKLYPPMVANPDAADTPVGVWLDADAAPVVGESKTGRPQVKAGGKGTQGGSGQLAYRPGWHLGEIPYALQFNRKDDNGEKTLFPKNFVWAEVEYADDVDYQKDAEAEGMTENGKFNHALAGLKRVPVNGSYRYRTNPNPQTDPWIITGAMKVNRILTPSEVDAMVREAGREPQRREEGAITDKQIEQLNKNLSSGQKESKHEAANDTIEKLGLQDRVTILDSTDGLKGKRKKAKGWFDTKTGKIVIVMPNHRDPRDVVKTILHEGVAHYGLRKLVGEKNMNEFLDRVFEAADKEVRGRIIDLAMRKYDRNFRKATEEYLAGLAEDTNFDNPTFLEKVKALLVRLLDKMGINLGDGLTDNELRYLLWKSYRNLVADAESYTEIAREVAMQSALEVGNFAPAVAAESMMREGDTADFSGIINDKGEINNDRLNEVINDVRRGVYQVSRISRELREENETVPAIAAQAIAKGFVEAELARQRDDTAERKGADGRNERGTGRGVEEGVPASGRQDISRLIKQWAKDNGYWFDEKRIKGFGDEIKGGSESRVFRSKDGQTIVKSTGPYNYDGYNQLVIESMEMFGKVFPNTPYTILGFAEDADGNLCVVASQPYVQGVSIKEYAEQQGWVIEDEITIGLNTARMNEYLEKKISEQYGLNVSGGFGNYENLYYMVTDLHRGNVIVDANGDVSVIDANISLNTDDKFVDYLNDDILFRDVDDRAQIREEFDRISGAHPKDKAKTIRQKVEKFLTNQVNKFRPLKQLEELMAKTLGRDIRDTEAVYSRATQMAGKTLSQLEAEKEAYLTPLDQAVNDVLSVLDPDGRRAKRTMTRDGFRYEAMEELRQQVSDYLIAKHGLERSEWFYQKALAAFEEKKKDPAWMDAMKARYDGLSDRTKAGMTFEEYIESRKPKWKDKGGLTGLAESLGKDQKKPKEEAESLVAEFEGKIGKESIDNLWRAINALNNRNLEIRYESGRMSMELYDELLSRHKYYVPLTGFAEETSDDRYDYEGSVKTLGDGDYRAKGRKSKPDDPLVAMMHQQEHDVIKSNDNWAKEALLNAAINLHSDLLSVSDSWYVYNEADDVWEERLAEVNDNMTAYERTAAIRQFEAAMKELQAQKKAKRHRGKLDVGVRVLPKRESQHEVEVWRGGRRYIVYVNGNPSLVRAYSESQDELKGLIRGIAKANRVEAQLFTTYSPEFAVKNMMRDTNFALFSAYVLGGTELWYETRKNIGLSRRVLPHLMKDGKVGPMVKDDAMRQQLEQWYKEFIENGGETGFTRMMTAEQVSKDLNETLFELATNGKNALTKVEDLAKKVQALNRWAENSTRFAAYITARQRGDTVRRAMDMAKNSTLNFNIKGYEGKKLRAWFAFFNARLQGVAQLARLAKQNPKRFAYGIGAAVLTGAMVPALNILLLGLFGDDDDWLTYETMTEYTGNNNLVLFIPLIHKFVKIPYSQELAPFSAIGNIWFREMMGWNRNKSAWQQELEMALAYLPVEVSLSDKEDTWAWIGSTAARTIFPTILQPTVEYIVNENFMNMPLRRDSKYKNDLAAWTRAYENRTSGSLISLSKWLNGGGSKNKWGKAEFLIDPSFIQHVVEGTAGGVGSFIGNARDLFTEPDWFNHLPFVRKFMFDSDKKKWQAGLDRAYSSYAYDLVNKYDGDIDAIRNDNSSSLEYAREIWRKSNTVEAGLYKTAKYYRDELGKSYGKKDKNGNITEDGEGRKVVISTFGNNQYRKKENGVDDLPIIGIHGMRQYYGDLRSHNADKEEIERWRNLINEYEMQMIEEMDAVYYKNRVQEGKPAANWVQRIVDNARGRDEEWWKNE